MQCSLPYPTWISFPSNLKLHSARQLKNCSSHEGFTGLPVPNQTLKSSPLSWMIFWLTKPFLQGAREALSGFTSWRCAWPFAAMPLCPRVWRGTRLCGTQAAAGGKGAGGATAVGVLGGGNAGCYLNQQQMHPHACDVPQDGSRSLKFINDSSSDSC